MKNKKYPSPLFYSKEAKYITLSWTGPYVNQWFYSKLKDAKNRIKTSGGELYEIKRRIKVK